MKTEKTYDVFMACGKGFVGVLEKANVGTRLAVCANDGSVKGRPKDAEGKMADCWNCQCIKKAKRKESIFYSEADNMRSTRFPSGKLWTCCVYHTVDHIREIE